MKPVWTTEQIMEGLPYRLTRAQLNAWHEIERDLCSHSLMSRLVQGDVGSGKTILAFLAMVLTVENGYQAALMVPTEVLANQHFEAFTKLMEEQGNHFLSSCSSHWFCHPEGEKENLRGNCVPGEANVIIGTHALIQEKVMYENLGLVITDEQHRFWCEAEGSPDHQRQCASCTGYECHPYPQNPCYHCIRRPGYFYYR
mgnify:CR=1 FL=1